MHQFKKSDKHKLLPETGLFHIYNAHVTFHSFHKSDCKHSQAISLHSSWNNILT